MMKFILLDSLSGFIFIVPYVFPLAVAGVSYFFNQSQVREKARLGKIESDNEKDHNNFMGYIKSLEKEDEDIRKMLNDVNIQILKDINALTVKLAEYKRDIR